ARWNRRQKRLFLPRPQPPGALRIDLSSRPLFRGRRPYQSVVKIFLKEFKKPSVQHRWFFFNVSLPG
ncbi:MAG: hypothetical protein PHH93_09215, partial [Prolixibacteraceae bacterium]|nr:hypothetical protein [Prolixibacteraceae bacterium]